MSVNIVRTTTARADLTRILTYFLDQDDPSVAGRFLEAYEMTLGFIAEFPELAGVWESDDERLKGVRVKPIDGFEKYLVFYRVMDRGVYILRLFHGHQDIENLL